MARKKGVIVEKHGGFRCAYLTNFLIFGWIGFLRPKHFESIGHASGFRTFSGALASLGKVSRMTCAHDVALINVFALVFLLLLSLPLLAFSLLL